MVKFTDLFDDCTSQGVKLPTEEYKDKGKFLVVDQGQDVIAGYTDRENGVYTDVPAIIFGDHTRVIKYVDKPFFLGADGTKLLKCKDTNANYRYLYYALRNARIPNTGYNRHYKWLKEVEIEYPDADRQTEVAEILGRVEKLIAERKNELEKLDTLIKARFVEMFGTLDNPSRNFKYDTLKNLCYKITDGKHGGCTSEKGTERYFVGAREIFDDRVNYDTAPEINVDEFEKDYKRCNVEKGDFLIVNTGATIGKSAIATDDRTEHTLLQKSVALLKVKPEVLNPVFLKYCYRVNERMYKVESASAQPNLLLSKINETKINVPELIVQTQFADFVAQVDKSKVVIQKSLDETQLLFDSLMQEYFG